ncbi:MAG: hypothetical protein Ct9H300mP31_12830 [Acidimicrobiaceae bacterium]|nr:MAG: hypothetical protein Ct9H300mP31_12830 [Acidimicrobiaceae bacterium]
MAGAIPLHLLPDSASVGPDGRASIGGCDLVDLADEYGTPLFVYDEDHLRSRCREAVAAFGDGVAYASKAFLCGAMARLAYEEGMCLDVATGGELYVARHAGVPGDRLVLHGNNKSDSELAMALDEGVGRIVVDSFDELDRLDGPGRPDRLPASGPVADHAGSGGPHPRVRGHRPGRLQVRLHGVVRPGRGGRGTGHGVRRR